MIRKTLFESPTGLVHLGHVDGNKPAFTVCGREVNRDTWTRIAVLDDRLSGKSNRTITVHVGSKIELPKCERCFR